MASKALTTSAFIAKLLAPLPDGEEPVDTPAFRKECILFDGMRWSKALERVDEAFARWTLAAISRRNSTAQLVGQFAELNALRDEVGNVILTFPAPTMKHLRWKRAKAKQYFWDKAKHVDVYAAIARDEARLAES